MHARRVALLYGKVGQDIALRIVNYYTHSRFPFYSRFVTFK